MATRKTRRIQMMMFGAVLLAASAPMVSLALRDATDFFFSPTELLAEPHSPDQLLRVGGLVVTGTLTRGTGEETTFEVTDGNGTIAVSYTGILPDLFGEGQGVVAMGYLRNGAFEATEILAKHDENYVPKEVVEALKEQGHWEAEESAPTAGGTDAYGG